MSHPPPTPSAQLQLRSPAALARPRQCWRSLRLLPGARRRAAPAFRAARPPAAAASAGFHQSRMAATERGPGTLQRLRQLEVRCAAGSGGGGARQGEGKRGGSWRVVDRHEGGAQALLHSRPRQADLRHSRWAHPAAHLRQAGRERRRAAGGGLAARAVVLRLPARACVCGRGARADAAPLPLINYLGLSRTGPARRSAAAALHACPPPVGLLAARSHPTPALKPCLCPRKAPHRLRALPCA